MKIVGRDSMNGPMNQLAAIRLLDPAGFQKGLNPAEPRQSEPPSARSTKAVRATLEQVVRTLLMIPKDRTLNDSTTFIDLGLDSIIIVRFIRELSDHFQLELRETLVYDYPTIGGLAQFIANMQSRQVRRTGREASLPLLWPMRFLSLIGWPGSRSDIANWFHCRWKARALSCSAFIRCPGTLAFITNWRIARENDSG